MIIKIIKYFDLLNELIVIPEIILNESGQTMLFLKFFKNLVVCI